MKTRWYTLVFLLGIFPIKAKAELTLEQALTYGIQHHPALEAERFRESSQAQDKSIIQSRYYPQISGMALATTGFPGSAGATGIAGLMVSPYHKGPSAGIFLEQNIWDFGRTSGSIEVAEKENEALKKEREISALRIAQAVAQSYFLCSKDRSLYEIYSKIANESEKIEKEVKHFVQVGQRSIVEKYLSESQTLEAKTIADDYQKRLSLDQAQLSFLTGKDVSMVLCPTLEDTSQTLPIPPTNHGDRSPLLARAEAAIAVAKAEKDLIKKDFNPRIVGVASLGYMQDTEFGIALKNYSAAVGFILPLFEGFKTSSQSTRAELKLIQREKELESTRFGIDSSNLTYDRSIESAKTRIENLKHEVLLGETAFNIAKGRYFALQGRLVDLREALRNLSRSSSQLKEALYELSVQNTEKSLINGQWNHVLRVGTLNS